MCDVFWSLIILSCILVFIVVVNVIVCVFVLMNVCFCIYMNGFFVLLVVFDVFIGGFLFFVNFSGLDFVVVFLEGYLVVFVLLFGVGNICLVIWDCYIVVVKLFDYKKVVKCYFIKLIIVIWVIVLVIFLLFLIW